MHTFDAHACSSGRQGGLAIRSTGRRLLDTRNQSLQATTAGTHALSNHQPATVRQPATHHKITGNQHTHTNHKQQRITTTSPGMPTQPQTHTRAHPIRTPAAWAAKAASPAGALEHSRLTRAAYNLQAANSGKQATNSQKPNTYQQPATNDQHIKNLTNNTPPTNKFKESLFHHAHIHISTCPTQ